MVPFSSPRPHPGKTLLIDGNVFDEAAISDETRVAVADLEAVMDQLPPVYDLGVEIVREARRNGQGLLPIEPHSDMAIWRDISVNEHSVRIRIFKPETINGVYLHIHGGGHSLGAADQQDQTLEAMARALNIGVVSVEYRLAPENIWPAPPDDCEIAALWLAENAQTEFGTDRLVIGGESAGAHLSAVTLLRMRDKHHFTGFCGANLIYGIYDLALTPSAKNFGTRNLIINTPIIEWFGQNMLPEDKFPLSTRRDPEFSPLYADLSDMPPALFTVGTLDPILDDSLFMAQRWVQSNNLACLEIYPGGIHAFDVMKITIAKQARERMNMFVQDCLAGTFA